MKFRSVEFGIKINKVLIITLAWMTVGLAITVYDYILFQSSFSAGTSQFYSFSNALFLNLGSALVGSLLGGCLLVFYFNERFRDRPYWHTIFLVTLSFVAVVIFITVSMVFVFSILRTGKFITDTETQVIFKKLLFSPGHLKNIMVWSVVVSFTQLMLHINDKFGKGVLWNFIKGRYHQAREESRIFMFVDLISSTTIAEELGNEKYHSLLRDFFSDITNSIIYNKGEIYQYIGDEIVISWKLPSAYEDDRCLKCFFDMRKAISAKKEKYELTYGLVPDFKAGLHYGKVIAGEIGIIKRDITYSGDVLNTTSRIQNKCNEYKVKFLGSDELLRLLPIQELYEIVSIGEIDLKGKLAKVALSGIELKSQA